MKWYWLLAIGLMGFSPLYSVYDSPEKVSSEIKNMENDLQSQQFNIVQSTPNLQEMKDGQIVIVSSGTYNKIMWRSGIDIYAVNGSCVTVRR